MQMLVARFTFRILVALLLVAGEAAGQGRARGGMRPDSALHERMGGFMRAVEGTHIDSAAAFFPAEGDWTWIRGWVGQRESYRDGQWRFPGSDAGRVIDEGGPLCVSFHHFYHSIPIGEFFVTQVPFPAGWRYAGGGRYVAEEGRVFVEWRREGATWVVSVLRDLGYAWEDEPRLLGYSVGGMVRRDTLLPISEPATDFTSVDWVRRGLPIHHYGRYEIYGVPRPLAPNLVRRYGMAGRVPLYVEAATRLNPPSVLYALIGPDQFQP